MEPGLADHPGMPRTVQKRTRTLYLGQWLRRLGRKQKEIADAAGVGESYISQLISNPRKGASPSVLLDISEELGISINDLYMPPPPADAVAAVGQLEPSQIAALGRLLEKLPPRGRK